MISNIFWFDMIWYRRSLATLVLCWRLAESDVTVMLSVTCLDYVGDIITQMM